MTYKWHEKDRQEDPWMDGDDFFVDFLRTIILIIVLAVIATWGIMSCDEPANAAEGYATFYTKASCQAEGNSGIYTASKERFYEDAMTCALPHRKFGKYYLIYGEKTGKGVLVRHNDFGPGKGPRKNGVIVDLTPIAFQEVCGDLKIGKCKVNVQEVK